MWCLKVCIYFLISGSNNSLAQLTSWSRLLNLNLNSSISWSSFSFSCLPAEGNSLQKWGFLLRGCVRARGILSIYWAFHPSRIWVGTSGWWSPWPRVMMVTVLYRQAECVSWEFTGQDISLQFWAQNFGQDTSIVPCAFWRVSCPL